MEHIKGLTPERVQGMLRLQNEYYARMQQEQKEKARADAMSFLAIVLVIIPIIILLGTMAYFDMRDPPMYIEERECLKYEKTDATALVGVGPNPLKWRVTSDPCIEYAEPTLRLNPLYLEMVREENEKAMLAEYYENQYASDEEEY